MKDQLHTHWAVKVALSEIARGLGEEISPEFASLKVSGVSADSRKIIPGCLFVAIEGDHFDGHEYLHEVVDNGCAAVVVQKRKAWMAADLDVPVLTVKNPRLAFSSIAASVYGHPEKQLVVTGITGTNGKTTTSYILEAILKTAGFSPGVIGTVSYRYDGFERQATLTTPEPDELFGMLRGMVDHGVTHLLMEVSSHSIIQDRFAGIDFDVAVFTNLTRDHLDFHEDMEEYFQAKRSLFTRHLKRTGAAVIPGRDQRAAESGPDWGGRLVEEFCPDGDFDEESRPALLQCGGSKGAVRFSELVMDLKGIRGTLQFPKGDVSFTSTLIGGFNTENILVAAGAAYALAINVERIGEGINRVGQVPGRLEKIGDGEPAVFVDYAHTPDAMANVMMTLKSLGGGRLIVVFGCGGDRDRGKRKLMGEVAARLAEVVIVTSDNPRSEDPMEIIREIEQGVQGRAGSCLEHRKAKDILRSCRSGYDIIESRKEAIEVVVGNCKADDVVLICGKGHEDYQIIGEERCHFDDREEALRCLAGRGGAADDE